MRNQGRQPAAPASASTRRRPRPGTRCCGVGAAQPCPEPRACRRCRRPASGTGSCRRRRHATRRGGVQPQRPAAPVRERPLHGQWDLHCMRPGPCKLAWTAAAPLPRRGPAAPAGIRRPPTTRTTTPVPRLSPRVGRPCCHGTPPLARAVSTGPSASPGCRPGLPNPSQEHARQKAPVWTEHPGFPES